MTHWLLRVLSFVPQVRVRTRMSELYQKAIEYTNTGYPDKVESLMGRINRLGQRYNLDVRDYTLHEGEFLAIAYLQAAERLANEAFKNEGETSLLDQARTYTDKAREYSTEIPEPYREKFLAKLVFITNYCFADALDVIIYYSQGVRCAIVPTKERRNADKVMPYKEAKILEEITRIRDYNGAKQIATQRREYWSEKERLGLLTQKTRRLKRRWSKRQPYKPQKPQQSTAFGYIISEMPVLDGRYNLYYENSMPRMPSHKLYTNRDQYRPQPPYHRQISPPASRHQTRMRKHIAGHQRGLQKKELHKNRRESFFPPGVSDMRVGPKIKRR